MSKTGNGDANIKPALHKIRARIFAKSEARNTARMSARQRRIKIQKDKRHRK